MRSFRAWSGRLAMASACLLAAGCGGGDIPDPSSDSHAAPEGGAVRGPAPREQPSEESAKPEPTALASNTPAPDAEKAGPASRNEAPPKSEEKPAEEKAAPSAKGDSSGTDDMLKMSGDSAPAKPPAGGASTPGASPSPAPGAAPGSTPSPGASPSPSTPGGSNPSTPEAGPGGGSRGDRRMPTPGPSASPGAAPGGNATGPAPAAPPMGGAGNTVSPKGDEGRGAAPGAPGAGPGGASGFGVIGGGGPANPGGPGSGGGQNAALSTGLAAFRMPNTAVMAFLDALKNKNKDRLAQCTALHAPTEAAEKHRKIFAAIVEGSITDDELDEMSKALGGYQVTGLLSATSTGRMGVLISKMDGRDRMQRTVMTRKEKEGWKVMDVDSALEFKFIQMPRGGRGRRR